MRTFSEADYQRLLAPHLRKVFVDTAAVVPFTPRLRSRLLFFDVIYELTGAQFDALTNALASIGERTYFLSYIERPQETDPEETIAAWDGFPFHYELDVGDREGYYQAARYPLEQVLYSRSGSWGLQCGGLDFGLIAGEPPLVTTFRDQLSPGSCDLSFFAQRVRAERADRPEPSWLPALLKYLAGSEPPQNDR